MRICKLADDDGLMMMVRPSSVGDKYCSHATKRRISSVSTAARNRSVMSVVMFWYSVDCVFIPLLLTLLKYRFAFNWFARAYFFEFRPRAQKAVLFEDCWSWVQSINPGFLKWP